MRRAASLLGGLAVGTAGCLAPFSWPDERPPAAEPVGTLTSRAPAAADDLATAADCLDRGDEAAAIPHLRGYVRANPDALLVRAHLAELLFRRGEASEARTHYERFAAGVGASGPMRERLVHCHTRLMELAEADADPYRAALHRGIGLLELVRRWDADPARRDEAAAERTVAKAAAALREATAKRPTDARANLYLADAYERLGQASAARTAMRAARAGLPDPGLSDTERGRIEEASP